MKVQSVYMDIFAAIYISQNFSFLPKMRKINDLQKYIGSQYFKTTVCG